MTTEAICWTVGLSIYGFGAVVTLVLTGFICADTNDNGDELMGVILGCFTAALWPVLLTLAGPIVLGYWLDRRFKDYKQYVDDRERAQARGLQGQGVDFRRFVMEGSGSDFHQRAVWEECFRCDQYQPIIRCDRWWATWAHFLANRHFPKWAGAA